MLSVLSNGLINYGHFLFRYRNTLFPLVLLVLVILFPPGFIDGNANYDAWMDISGILVIIFGQIVRAAVIGLAYIKRGGVNKKIHADKLVKNGLFAHCRNPLYVGNLMILFGFLIIHNNLWVYLFGGTFFLGSYYAIVKAEESFLYNKFGTEFNEYLANVNRWAINFSGITKTLESMEFNWRRVIIKDYSTMLTWVLTVILLLIREYITLNGIDYSVPFIFQMSLPITFALLLSLIVRILKKNGRLVS